MPKKKNSMALFEVISKTRDKNPDSEVIVPGWIRPGQKDQEPQTPAPQSDAPVEPVEPTPVETPQKAPEPESSTPLLEEASQKQNATDEEVQQPVIQEFKSPEPAETTASGPADAPAPQPKPAPKPMTSATLATPTRQTPSTATPGTDNPPLWSTEGGKLTLSLNYVSCTVAAMVLLFLIVTAFVIGRVTGGADQTVEPVNPLTIARKVDKFYMVIQTLPNMSAEAKTEADRIAWFCNLNGEPATVQKIPGRTAASSYLIVWSATPFDKETGPDVTKHAQMLQDKLGVKYAEKYESEYKFTQPEEEGKLTPKMYPLPKKRR